MKKILVLLTLLTAACHAQQETTEPTTSSEACCKYINEDLSKGSGCRAQGRCKADEPVWMRGNVECSPVSEECHNGRCCHYRKPNYIIDE